MPPYFEVMVVVAHPGESAGFADMTIEHAFKQHGMINLPLAGWRLPSGRPEEATPVRVALFASTTRHDGTTHERLRRAADDVRAELMTRDVTVIMRALD